MIVLTTIESCRTKYIKAIVSSYSQENEQLNQQTLETFMDIFMQAWVPFLDDIPETDARDVSGNESSRPQGYSLREQNTLFKRLYPMAAKGNLPRLCFRRQIRVSNLLDVVIEALLGALAADPSSRLALALSQQYDEEVLPILVSTAIGIVAALKKLRALPRLEPDEHCVFIQACYKVPLASSFNTESVYSWFENSECNIPAKRYWKCSFRGSFEICDIKEQLEDSGWIVRILKRLVKKGYFEDGSDSNNDNVYYITHQREVKESKDDFSLEDDWLWGDGWL